jgi:hypothetical protein
MYYSHAHIDMCYILTQVGDVPLPFTYTGRKMYNSLNR